MTEFSNIKFSRKISTFPCVHARTYEKRVKSSLHTVNVPVQAVLMHSHRFEERARNGNRAFKMTSYIPACKTEIRSSFET